MGYLTGEIVTRLYFLNDLEEPYNYVLSLYLV